MFYSLLYIPIFYRSTYAPDVIPLNNFNSNASDSLDLHEEKLLEAIAEARREAQAELAKSKLDTNNLSEEELNINQFYLADETEDDVSDVQGLKKLVDQLKTTNTNLEQQIDKLNAEHEIVTNDFKKKVTLLRTSCEEDNQKIDKLECFCNSLTKESDLLAKTSELLRESNNDLKADIDIFVNKNAEKQTIINSLLEIETKNKLQIEKLTLKNSTGGKYDKEVETLKIENQELSSKITTYKMEKNNLDKNIEDLKNDVRMQKDKLGLVHKQMVDLQQVIDKKDVEINSIKNEIMNSDEMSSRIQLKYKEDIDSSLIEIENKESELNKVSKKLIKNQDELQKLTTDLQLYKENEEKYKQDINRLNILESDLKDVNSLLEESNLKLSNKDIIISDMKTNFEDEIKNLTCDLDNSEIKKHNISVENLQEEIIIKQELITNQNLKINSLSNAFESLEQSVNAEIVSKNGSLQIIDDNNTELKDLKAKLAEGEDLVAKIELLEQAHKSTIDENLFQMQKLEDDYKLCQKENQQVANDLQVSKDNLQQSKDKYNCLEMKLEKNQSESSIQIALLEDKYNLSNESFEQEKNNYSEIKIKLEVNINKTLFIEILNKFIFFKF